ncbi:MAG TPA: response regulator transcription factor [Acidimicrobiales bacterium]|nr:response regulator transcription factor [Acidimicrobiales bacterium]
MTIRVFLLDDHEIVRRGLAEVLEADGDRDLEVVGEAGSVEEAMRRVPATRPDVAILDVRLPDGNGIDVCRDLRSANPELAVIMLTSFADDDALFSAVLAGANGFLLKQVRGSEIADAVRRAARGESLLDPVTTARVFDRIRARDAAGTQQPDDQLTPHEREILELIAEGMTNRQIGERLFLAEKTIKNHVTSILGKLGMSRRTEAAAYAARLAERRAARGDQA